MSGETRFEKRVGDAPCPQPLQLGRRRRERELLRKDAGRALIGGCHLHGGSQHADRAGASGSQIALYTGQPFIMAMSPTQTVMATITLIAAAINLNDGETNAIEGMTHVILFATFVMLTLIGL